jgi:hypothetical protein
MMIKDHVWLPQALSLPSFRKKMLIKSVRDFPGLRECGEEKELGGPFTFSQFFSFHILFLVIGFFLKLVGLGPSHIFNQNTTKNSIVCTFLSGWDADGRTDGRTDKSCQKLQQRRRKTVWRLWQLFLPQLIPLLCLSFSFTLGPYFFLH